MLIYPDSKDLIDLCRGRFEVSISDLSEMLLRKGHQVVLSLDTLLEMAAPMRDGSRLLEIRRDLNRVEQLSHIFVNEARIRILEVQEAISALEAGREYDFARVHPFAAKLADAIDINGDPLFVIEHGLPISTRNLINHGIFESLDYIRKREPLTFDVQRRREAEWVRIIESDRSMSVTPELGDHFVTTMERNLPLWGIPAPPSGIESFARWVYESPLRCPGVRLAFETLHRFRRNRQARPRASDVIDLVRMAAVPYVDFFITDSAMSDYCRQAATDIGHSYPGVSSSLQSVLARLAE
jgi:hypothetical protein